MSTKVIKSLQSKPRNIKSALKLFATIISVISMQWIFTPVKALAMAAGGAPKGPVAPMKR